MRLKNSIKIFLQILFWGLILVTPLYTMSNDDGGVTDYKPYISYLIRMGILVILFYLNYLYLIDKFLFSKRFVLYIGINAILVVVLMALQTIAMRNLFTPDPANMQRPRMEMPIPEFGTPQPGMPQGKKVMPFPKNEEFRPRPDGFIYMRLISDYLLIILIIGISVALKATYRWYRDSINLESIKSSQLEADLRNLRTQLNPHFLFNTLNNIYSLIVIDSEKAQESVHRLSGMLRYVLYENEQFVPMDKELYFTQNYIDLMKLRLSQNVKLDVEINDNGSTDTIASLMFMTLIENAFKHGIKNGAESFIDIKIDVEAGKNVVCTVENSLAENTVDMESKNSGIGLVNLSKRLDLIYPNKHEFITEKKEDRFRAMLRIELDDKKQIE